MADSLRPCSWNEYVGQDRLRAELDARITAARTAKRPLDPILLSGPPGSGKTSLAEMIAVRMGEPLETLVMPVSHSTMLTLVKSFEGVVLLDEVQELTKAAQTQLCSLLEFGFLQEPNGRRVRCGDLSIIAATTNPERLCEPFYDRFLVPDYDPYTDEEMTLIVLGMAEKAGIPDIDYDTASQFGVAACGVPRKARKFIVAYEVLWRTRRGNPSADDVMQLLRTTHDGLTKQHMDYLVSLKALGARSGLKHIADLLRLHPDVVTTLERLLFEKGYVEFTDRGRSLTRAGFARIKNYYEEAEAA